MSNNKILKAASSLQSQIDKANSGQINYDTWKLQCQSIIEKYFSKDSKEYSWFDRRVYSDADYGLSAEEQSRQRTAKAIKATQEHLSAAIDTLKIKGAYNHPKPNFLYRLSDTWLTTLLLLNFSAYGLLFYIGRWTVETEQKSISPSVSPSTLVTKNPSTQPTDSTYDSTRNKKN